LAGTTSTDERSLMGSSSKRYQTHAKRAREQALRERRARKEEKRAARRANSEQADDGRNTGQSENA